MSKRVERTNSSGSGESSSISQAIRLYLKIFLIAGMIWTMFEAAIFALFFSLKYDAPFKDVLQAIMPDFLKAGLFFGASMALVLGTLQMVAARRKNASLSSAKNMTNFLNANRTQRALSQNSSRLAENNRSSLNVHKKITVRLLIPYDEGFDLCLASLTPLNISKLTKEDRKEGVIAAKTRISLWSWGEYVSFILEQEASQVTVVQVSSRPVIPTTLVDYGKGTDNLKKVLAHLEPYTTESVRTYEI